MPDTRGSTRGGQSWPHRPRALGQGCRVPSLESIRLALLPRPGGHAARPAAVSGTLRQRRQGGHTCGNWDKLSLGQGYPLSPPAPPPPQP